MYHVKHVPDSFTSELSRQFLVAKVTAILLFAHEKKLLVSYVDLAKATGEFSGGSALASALGEVMENCHREGLELLPAIVSKSDGGSPVGPGDGFYRMAEHLGYGNTADKVLTNRPESEQFQFWLDALKKLGYDDLVRLRFI
jgi:hypothetical protein